MAIIKDGNGGVSQLGIDPVSFAAKTTNYDSTGRNVAIESKQTFSVSTTPFTPAATASDIFRITGSAAKTIRIVDVSMGGTATAASVINAFTIKRSTLNTAGTAVVSTIVPHDSTNTASSVTVNHYTTNPTLGTAVGTIKTSKVFLPIAATAAQSIQNNILPMQNILSQPIVLRGVNESLCVNLGAVALPAGAAQFFVNITWIEE